METRSERHADFPFPQRRPLDTGIPIVCYKSPLNEWYERSFGRAPAQISSRADERYRLVRVGEGTPPLFVFGSSKLLLQPEGALMMLQRAGKPSVKPTL